MAIGRADRQARFNDAALLLGEELKPGGVYRLLAEHGDRLLSLVTTISRICSRVRVWGRPTVAARGGRDGDAAARRWRVSRDR